MLISCLWEYSQQACFETKNKSAGSAPKESSGSTITDSHVMSRPLPLYDFKTLGSTPRGTRFYSCL